MRDYLVICKLIISEKDYADRGLKWPNTFLNNPLKCFV